ncbi:Glycoside hydrolase [Pseudozyma hubeiensis]|nr:Glycoside hydrolase [Pseudozyma hubeiensis]
MRKTPLRLGRDASGDRSASKRRNGIAGGKLAPARTVRGGDRLRVPAFVCASLCMTFGPDSRDLQGFTRLGNVAVR